MKTALTGHGTEVTTVEASIIKGMLDGVTVNARLNGDKAPFVLQLTLNWPDSLPTNKIDFALIATNNGHSFMCLFTYGAFGPKLIYSENCHFCLAKDLKHTNEVIITEVAQANDENRAYACELKHCFD